MSSDREIRAILFRCKRAYYILPFAFVYIDMYTHTHTHTHRFKYTIIFIDYSWKYLQVLMVMTYWRQG